uniref:class I SAM-dependent methyltransferase n=1 Tax=Flavobacterium sp. TaxID=239 RepID=UPI0040498FBC
MKSWDPIWEKIYLENPWGKYPGESLIQFIARNFYKRERKNLKILEVGCGPGANIWYLSRENFSTYGIDGSETAIEIAKERLSKENLIGHLLVGDIVNLPYDDNMFDAVIDVECIYSNDILNSKKILNEVYRVLKKDGLFYSRTMSDSIYIGKSREELGIKQYNNISDGPLAGRGFVRLMSKDDIKVIYGEKFNIMSIDKLEYTIENENIFISEFIIISKKM